MLYNESTVSKRDYFFYDRSVRVITNSGDVRRTGHQVGRG